MTKAPDAVVVGAGIVGAACAEALAAEGLSVVVLDSAFAGSGTTAAGMGHVVAMDDSPAQLALTALSVGLWRKRAAELPGDVEDDACGTLWVAADEEEMAAVRSKAGTYRAAGVEAEVLDARSLAAAEPNLRPGLAGALLVPGDRVLYPPNGARWLLERARGLGAVVREGARATRLAPRRVETEGGSIETGLVVNAAGAAAPALTPGLPIEPRKGHLVITDRAAGFVRRQIVELGYLKSAHAPGPKNAASVAFNVQPRRTGQLLVGSSREYVGWDASINGSLLARMLARAFEFLPGLRTLSAIRTWTGFRPATPDKLPLVGLVEPGLAVAAGHEGLGITTSLGTARLLADLVVGRTPAIDATPFAPARFGLGAHG